MGAKINIAYDSNIVGDEDIAKLSRDLPALVSRAMNAGDVFLYVDHSHASVGVDPIEIFIQVNHDKVTDPAALLDTVVSEIRTWKQESGFEHLVNVNVIPVEWYSEIGI